MKNSKGNSTCQRTSPGAEFKTMKRDWPRGFAMKMSKKHLSAFLAAIIFATGCSTESANQNLGGIATVSALVVALPLIPFALPISAIEQNKDRKSDEALYAKLDPVYQKRIEMIEARSPKADAEKSWNEGTSAFLPSLPNGNYYGGLETTGYNLKNGEENAKEIAANKLLTYLQTLLSDDPLQQQVQNWNDTYKEFLHARWDYEKAFNLEMYQRIQSAKATDGK